MAEIVHAINQQVFSAMLVDSVVGLTILLAVSVYQIILNEKLPTSFW